ncbi:MAG: GMC family oxidoreductase, partial [Kiloniellales bacterium]|nr:GMC family oxidoreductase [Kiloniellales bacterium]
YFILTCGGIETPRLLLASKDKSSSGIGNEHDLVGRYFMQHPKGRHGLVKLKRRTRVFPFYTRLFETRRVGVTAGVKFSERLQEQDGLLNHRLVFHPIYSLNEGYASDLYRALRRVQSHTNGTKGTCAEALSRLQACPGLTRSELLDVLGALTWPASYTVINHMEQIPDRESRVFLSREKDEFGQWRLDTNWRISALEKESLCQLHELTREAIEGPGIGWFQSNLLANADDWPILQDSAHYLGATRMHRDPKKGVTNENCRVHGVRNLYAVGSSVFPTGGYANPTLTILALSIRLSEHLKAFDLTRRW